MKILWIFLLVVISTAHASICRVCIDEPIFTSEDETIAGLVESVIVMFPDSIPNCTSTEPALYLECRGACLSADFYNKNETNTYLGSLRYCDHGKEYYVNHDAFYLTCAGFHCNDQVPVNYCVYIFATCFIVLIAVLTSMIGCFICLMCYKTLRECFHNEDDDFDIDATPIVPHDSIEIQLDQLDNCYEEVGTRSILI